MRPHRLQPTRFCRPWDSPGKNTGVGCHFLLQCMKVKSKSEVVQLCLTLCNPMDCSLPGSSVHGIFQARVLEWGAIAFSHRGPSFLQNRTTMPWLERQWLFKDIFSNYFLERNNFLSGKVVCCWFVCVCARARVCVCVCGENSWWKSCSLRLNTATTAAVYFHGPPWTPTPRTSRVVWFICFGGCTGGRRSYWDTVIRKLQEIPS